jgi:aspartate/methionine/tyrosine aminotransferase
LDAVLLPNDRFDDLYTAVYAILDDAKAERHLVKLYKGSPLSTDPHESVLAFGEFFARRRRGLLGYACAQVNPGGPPSPDDLKSFDATYQPRVPTRRLLTTLATMAGRPHESVKDLLTYLASRIHRLGAYRGGSSAFDEESRAVASIHFRQLGVPSDPDQVLVSCGGAKGILLAFCAALMCRRNYDELHHVGGTVLAPEGFYQSLRLIPAIFGGGIDTVPQLTGSTVSRWLVRTAEHPNRALYIPLVNNATGEVLTVERARDLGAEILTHNARNRGNPVFVVGDDVYAGSHLDPHLASLPIGAVPGMSDWTASVVSPSKTFALPTSRVAFATTANRRLHAALRHYRTVFAHGRVPQATEFAAAAALALTPVEWINDCNHRYRERLARVTAGIELINREVGADMVSLRSPQGGWYVSLGLARTAFPVPVASSVDAFAVLLHYGGERTDSGLGLLPGELFGQRLDTTDTEVTLRATLAVGDHDLTEFTDRLLEALLALRGPNGVTIAEQALRRARNVADVDTILSHTHY